MLEFTHAYVEKQGGKVVGEEYLPMDGERLDAHLYKLRSAGADALLTSTAGGAPNVTLTKQLRAAGINSPTATWRSTKAPPKAWEPTRKGSSSRPPT